MADPTLAAIDRFFDAVDKTVDAADRVLNRGKQAIDIPKERRAKREVIDATPVERPVKKSATSSSSAPTASTAIARRPQFKIVEAIDEKTGSTIYVVTDGRNARTECSTREFAAQILRALEKTP